MSLKMIVFSYKNASAQNRAVVKSFKINTKNEGSETLVSDSSKSTPKMNGFTNVLKIIEIINENGSGRILPEDFTFKIDTKK